MNKRRGLPAIAGLGIAMLSGSLLFTACGSGKISVKEAEAIIRDQPELQVGTQEGELAEITPDAVWADTKHQLFKRQGGGSPETYVISGGKAYVLGIGFGGYGVTSGVPYDVNLDGSMDLVYAYSFGSGIHRSVLAWMDLQTMTEHPVLSSTVPEGTGGFRTYDLLLEKDGKDIVVYRIADKEGKEAVYQALMKYPAGKDVEEMTLNTEGRLYRQNNELYYEPTDVK